jgi:DHA1 family bicyclomycin/chloramphenicol resistance-like MFS transporter
MTPRAVPIGLAVLLGALSMVSPFSIDTFFPSFRAMQSEFGIGPLEMQQSLTAYLLPFALLSLVHGPLSDALGRRPVVLWGIGIYSLASLACVFAPSYTTLLLFRAAQGMTAGVGMAVGRAVIRDRFEGVEAQRLMSAVTMVFSVAPALAPIVGGWIHVLAGWRAVFGFLTLFGAALWFAGFRLLAESHPPSRRVPLDARALALTSGRILSDLRFLPLAIAAGLSFSAALIYVGSAPALVFDHWGLSETQFATLFIPIVAGFMLGAALSGRLAGHWRPVRQVWTGFAVSASAAAIGVALQLLVDAPPRLAEQIVIAAISFGVQLAFPPITLRMLDLFPTTRGSVASVQSFVALLIGGTTIGVIAPLLQGSLLALSGWSLVASLTAAMLWGISVRRR